MPAKRRSLLHPHRPFSTPSNQRHTFRARMCIPGKWLSFWYPANFMTLSDETDVSIHMIFQSCVAHGVSFSTAGVSLVNSGIPCCAQTHRQSNPSAPHRHERHCIYNLIHSPRRLCAFSCHSRSSLALDDAGCGDKNSPLRSASCFAKSGHEAARQRLGMVQA